MSPAPWCLRDRINSPEFPVSTSLAAQPGNRRRIRVDSPELMAFLTGMRLHLVDQSGRVSTVTVTHLGFLPILYLLFLSASYILEPRSKSSASSAQFRPEGARTPSLFSGNCQTESGKDSRTRRITSTPQPLWRSVHELANSPDANLPGSARQSEWCKRSAAVRWRR